MTTCAARPFPDARALGLAALVLAGPAFPAGQALRAVGDRAKPPVTVEYAKTSHPFSRVPPPGVHPRVLVSPDDMTVVKRRLAETACGRRAIGRSAVGWPGRSGEKTVSATRTRPSQAGTSTPKDSPPTTGGGATSPFRSASRRSTARSRRNPTPPASPGARRRSRRWRASGTAPPGDPARASRTPPTSTSRTPTISCTTG